ncbi:PLP-dependent transferase [Acephala macrosclerotiorum]|nr:PLP-dependent transferase [Acephala macrosclerotiorum]
MAFSASSAYEKLRSIVDATPNDALPSRAALLKATNSLPDSLPSKGLGEAATEAHLLSNIIPGFNGPKTSSNYYGFVTGGVLPIAEVADNIVTAFDQNCAVHLPDQSISTVVEDKASGMLVELLNLGPDWNGRVFTTGATGSNILGMACGREAVISTRMKAAGINGSVGELGVLAACLKAGVKEVQVLTTMGHSSLYKAASVVGLGRASVKDIPFSSDEPWRMDIKILESQLQRSKDGVASIISISAGEVNTGLFAVNGLELMQRIRTLANKYGAWLHVDAAFGFFARALPDTEEFKTIRSKAAGIELADSITGDCHKMLNVPYDCGFFFTRSADTLSATFQNPNAVYLSADPSSIPSPLNIGLENSRRFRALPVYAVLLAYGRDHFAEVFAHQVRLARRIATFLHVNENFELLPKSSLSPEDVIAGTHIIVIFRAKDETINAELVRRINATRKMYVSGTKWDGKPACRIAVSTWRVDVERDSKLVQEVLESVLEKNV